MPTPHEQDAASDPARQETFREELTALIPAMRAFARSLSRDREEADDLAQDALYRALANWQTFRPGTNLKAWVFTILRNRFYSLRRVSGRESSLDQEFAEQIPAAPNDPMASFELDLVRLGLKQLPAEQREAIMLICAAGLSYEQAAAVGDCPVGTIKSRLSRGRASLAGLVEAGAVGEPDGARPSLALYRLMGDAERLANAPPAPPPAA